VERPKIRTEIINQITGAGNTLEDRYWLLVNSRLSVDELAEVAMHTELPTLSCKAFSMIKDEGLRCELLGRIFDEKTHGNLELITREAVSGIEDKGLLWDLYTRKSTPLRVKAYLEDEINGRWKDAPKISEIIRVEKK